MNIAKILGISDAEIALNVFAGAMTIEEYIEESKKMKEENEYENWWKGILKLPEPIYYLRIKKDFKLKGKMNKYEKRFLKRYNSLFKDEQKKGEGICEK